MLGVIKEYSEEKNHGIIIPYNDEILYSDDLADTLPKYHFNNSDLYEKQKPNPGVVVVFDPQCANTEQQRAINIRYASDDNFPEDEFYDDSSIYDDIDDPYNFYYKPLTIRERQHQPQYQENLTSSITKYLMNKPSVPQNKTDEIASMFSNVILASLKLGGSVVQMKAQKQLDILNTISRDYKISLNSILKYLEKQRLLENEQKALCSEFYQTYCTNMTTPERMKFMAQQNKYELTKKTIGVVGGLGGTALVGHILVNLSKIWSPSYQKTERYRMKHDKK